MTNPLAEKQRQEIEAAISAEKKVQAIRLYREATGVGLAEAKNAVEKLETELRENHPENFTPKPSGGGCGAVFVLLIGLAAVVVVAALKLTQAL